MLGSSVEGAPVLTSRPSSRLSRTYLWNVRRLFGGTKGLWNMHLSKLIIIWMVFRLSESSHFEEEYVRKIL